MIDDILGERLLLANLPTPMQDLEFLGCRFFMKRDDYTGQETSGNKLRKLEYHLREAIENKAEYIFTCGSEQSNHTRATAFAAASLGMKSRLFLRGKSYVEPTGNLYLENILGSEIVFLSKDEYKKAQYLMQEQKAEFESRGLRVFVIPEGGSSPLGIVGYVNFCRELIEPKKRNYLTGITLAAGTGGTAAGILIGNILFNLDLDVYVAPVLYGSSETKDRIMDLAQKTIDFYEFNIDLDPDRLIVLDGYNDEGYRQVNPEKIVLIKKLAAQTGILLDPVYTGKAFYAYNENFIRGHRDSRNVFLHTGGLLSIFGREEYLAHG